MKRYLLIILCYLIFLDGADLLNVRTSISGNTQRVVFDIAGRVIYGYERSSKDVISIVLKDCGYHPDLSQSNLKGIFIKESSIEKKHSNIYINLLLRKPFVSRTFRISNSLLSEKKNIYGDKIVLDIDKELLSQEELKENFAQKTKKDEKILKKEALKNSSSVVSDTSVAHENKKVKKESTYNRKLLKENNTKDTKKLKEEDFIFKKNLTTNDVIKNYKTGKYQLTLKLIDKLMKKQGGDLQLIYYKALSEYSLGKYSPKDSPEFINYLTLASRDMEVYLKNNPKEQKLRVKLAETYNLLGKKEKSGEHYKIVMQNLNNEKDKQEKEISSDSSSNKEPIMSSKTEKAPLNHNLIIIILAVLGSLIAILSALLIFFKIKMKHKLEEEVSDEELLKVEKDRAEIDSQHSDHIEDSEENASDDNSTSSEEEANSTDIASSSAEEKDLGYITYEIDDDLRNKILDLHEEGYSNEEIAEHLEISEEEIVILISQSEGIVSKNKNDSDSLQASSKSDIKEKIVQFLDQGLEAKEIAAKLNADIKEIMFLIGVISKDQESNSFRDTDQDIKQIKELAEKGFSKKEIAETMGITEGEIDVAASLYDIQLESKNSSQESFSESSVHNSAFLNEEELVKEKDLEEMKEESPDTLDSISEQDLEEKPSSKVETKDEILLSPSEEQDEDGASLKDEVPIKSNIENTDPDILSIKDLQDFDRRRDDQKTKDIKVLLKEGKTKSEISSELGLDEQEVQFVMSMFNFDPQLETSMPEKSKNEEEDLFSDFIVEDTQEKKSDNLEKETYQSFGLDFDMNTESVDEDYLNMKRVYRLLDEGKTIDEIEVLTDIPREDILMYKRIKNKD